MELYLRDGKTHVDEWADETTFSWLLVSQAPDENLRRVGDRIVMKVSNGRAYYRVVGCDAQQGFVCKLVKSEIRP